MAYTIAEVRQMLEDFAGEDGSYAEYVQSPQLRHFKAGVNAAWSSRWDYSLDRAEAWYARKHGREAASAFSDGWVYSASYL